MSKMEVILTDETTISNIEKIEEGDHGIYIYRDTGNAVEEVGYVPYDSLSYVNPV